MIRNSFVKTRSSVEDEDVIYVLQSIRNEKASFHVDAMRRNAKLQYEWLRNSKDVLILKQTGSEADRRMVDFDIVGDSKE